MCFVILYLKYIHMYLYFKYILKIILQTEYWE